MRSLIGMTAMMAVGGITGAAAPAAEKTADYSFDYSYPQEAARIPALRAWLEADKARLRTQTARDAAQERVEARDGGYPFRPYDTQKTWKLVTDTPRFLSLSGDVYSYTGGAHGTPGSMGMLWDKAAGKSIAPKLVFSSLPAAQGVIGPAFCAKLKAERRRRIGDAAASDGMFATCPTLKDLTVLLGSSGGGRFNRIGLIADPYVAGSYAEGAYEVTLPVTRALIGAVKPEYRTAFAVGR